VWITEVWRRELGVLVNWTDILDGEIVNAAWALAGMTARPRTSRRAAAGLDTAAWADTEQLVRDALAGIAVDPEMPDLSNDEAAELEAILKRHEVQGALQALLAVRLTDPPETDAAQARTALSLAMMTSRAATSGNAPPAQGSGTTALPTSPDTPSADSPDAQGAARLSEYFDEKISALVATLEGQVGFAGLAQVRAEAYNARIVALLGAIDRQVTALADPAHGAQAEMEFLERYRRQAHVRHGFLTPPDFDRRRRVPVADIFVPAEIRFIPDKSRDMGYLEQAATAGTASDSPPARKPADGQVLIPRKAGRRRPRALQVWDLIGRIDRTVLLGDPGGGKTTAANVLTDHFARQADGRIPFLVTLREYATNPIEWSVAEYIEQNVKALYQCPAPDGLVERLLLTGRALVIFDGLDELLDTSRRRDVSDRVEQFSSAYPLTPVLVTSRVVGYDQARLDDTQFTCYRLDGFREKEVADYASRWFAIQDAFSSAEAGATVTSFLAESAHAKDLRANPLLLSLMCILYRGTGSMPGDRAGIYAKCAELMLRKWDEQRDLYRKLGSDHLVEPTLRYLAWWLFTRDDSQTAATERELIGKATEFLYERGYETEEEARIAARDFIEFCRGRMWVFSDAGTAADGERLYGFTHRTFLEYFTAWYITVTSDSPEDLAQRLEPYTTSESWSTVGQLAIKLKGDTSDRGADRIYTVLLAQEPESYIAHLSFLTLCLESAHPSPAIVRRLLTAILDYVIDGPRDLSTSGHPLYRAFATSYIPQAIEVTTQRITNMVTSNDQTARTDAFKLLCELAEPTDRSELATWARAQADCYRQEILNEAESDAQLRKIALRAGTISAEQALGMPGGMNSLAEEITYRFTDLVWSSPYLDLLLISLFSDEKTIVELSSIGRYLTEHPKPPWIQVKQSGPYGPYGPYSYHKLAIDEPSRLGVTAVLAIMAELSNSKINREFPNILLPPRFTELFHEWSEGRVNFVEITGE
jgi:hypothetical protein